SRRAGFSDRRLLRIPRAPRRRAAPGPARARLGEPHEYARHYRGQLALALRVAAASARARSVRARACAAERARLSLRLRCIGATDSAIARFRVDALGQSAVRSAKDTSYC